MFWKMVLGALSRRKARHLIIAFTVGLGVSLATAMLGVMFDVGDKVNQELKSYGANLNIVPRGASMAGDKYEFAAEPDEAPADNYIQEDELFQLKMIFWAYNIVDFAPYLSAKVEFAGLAGPGGSPAPPPPRPQVLAPAGAEGAAPGGLSAAEGRSGHSGHSESAGHTEHAGHSESADSAGQTGSAPAAASPSVPEERPENIFALPAPSPQGAAAGREIKMTGTWFNKRLSLPSGEEVVTGMPPLKSWWQIEGEGGRDEDKFGVLAGRDLAEKLSLRPGSEFAVRGPDGKGYGLRVRGVFASGGEEDWELFAPIALVQEMAGLPGKAQSAEVSALTTPENELSRRAARNPDSLSQMEKDTWYCTAYISSIAYQIEEAMPGVRVKPVTRVAESEGPILEKTQLMIILLTALTLLSSALAVSNLVTASIMERSVEIGLMKALGASGFSVSLAILAEMAAVSFAGGFFGYLCGLGFAKLIGLSVFGVGVEVRPAVMPLAAIMVLLVILLGSVPALRAILRLKPAEVLHGR